MSYLLGHWSLDPFVAVVAAFVVLHEGGLARLGRRGAASRTAERWRRSWCFYAGLAVLLFAVDSPIDYWSGDYFSVHIVEHVLIAFFAPILLVAGAPWLPLLHGVPVALRRRVLRVLLLAPRRASPRCVPSGASRRAHGSRSAPSTP